MGIDMEVFARLYDQATICNNHIDYLISYEKAASTDAAKGPKLNFELGTHISMQQEDILAEDKNALEHEKLLQARLPILAQILAEFRSYSEGCKNGEAYTVPDKQLQIDVELFKKLSKQTNICQRRIKELNSYEKEVSAEVAKASMMKERGEDPYVLKQQENVLAESRMMVPKCRQLLGDSLMDLLGLLEELRASNPTVKFGKASSMAG